MELLEKYKQNFDVSCEGPDEGPSLKTSKFSLYFSGSCIPTNESLFILLALLTLAQTVQYYTRNACMQQHLAHISQTLFEHEVPLLRQHGTQARVMLAIAFTCSSMAMPTSELQKIWHIVCQSLAILFCEYFLNTSWQLWLIKATRRFK